MVSPSEKGGGYERLVCRRLSLWFSGGARDDIFWRTDSSGGAATRRRNMGKEARRTQHGDITAIDPCGLPLTDRFFIECKHVKNLEIGNVVWGTDTGAFFRMWEKERKQSRAIDRLPIMICRQNFRPDLLITPLESAPHFKNFYRIRKVISFIPQTDEFVAFMKFDDFLEETEFNVCRGSQQD